MCCLGCLSIQIACFDNNNDESMSVCVCLRVWPDKYVCVRKNKCDKIVLLLLLLFTCERASSLFLCVFRRLGIILLAFFATKKKQPKKQFPSETSKIYIHPIHGLGVFCLSRKASLRRRRMRKFRFDSSRLCRFG